MANVIDGGLTFAGYLQPPDVPADPIGDAWRGIAGPVGPQGPAGTLAAFSLPIVPEGLPDGTLWNNHGVLCVVAPSDFPTSPSGLPSGTLWNNGGVLCVV